MKNIFSFFCWLEKISTIYWNFHKYIQGFNLVRLIVTIF